MAYLANIADWLARSLWKVRSPMLFTESCLVKAKSPEDACEKISGGKASFAGGSGVTRHPARVPLAAFFGVNLGNLLIRKDPESRCFT
jgi:hypothetical protein